MKLFVIIATIVACASAAPTAELLHPSPVNPNVLVEIKPEEKIVLITDPKELAKFKRETKQPLYPTVLPEEHVHHITKRETTQNPVLPPEVITEKITEPKSNAQVAVTNSNNDNKKTQNDQEKDDKNVTTEVYQKPQGLPAIFSPSNKAIQQQKRDIPVPLVAKHQHPEESPKESNEKENHQDHDDQKVKEVFQKPQGLPAIFSPANDAIQPQKRDIPVPLVPKYHHPEESPKESNEKQDQENKKEVVSETHPNEDHVKTQLLQKSSDVAEQHKRDIPVPLVPKYHHPEESPKESNEKDDHEDKKVVVAENHHESQHDHVVKVGLEKPQLLPVVLKESLEDTQHKRDIPVPLVPKYHHPEESPKENNEDKKEVKIEDHHVPLTLPAHHHDHGIAEGFQKPQTLPLIIKENPEDTKQNKRDIPVPFVPKYQHPEESPKESNNEDKKDHQDKKDHEDKKEVNLEKPQQPQTNVKESNEDSQQQKRDVLVTKDETPKDNTSNEKKPQEESSQQHPVPQIHHVAQTLPNHHHEHVNFESIHRPQVLAFNQEHTSPPSFQKPEFLLKHQDHIIQNDNVKIVDDVKPHHISQTLPGHIHKHLTTEGLQKPQILPLHHQEHTVSTAALTHLPTHFHPDNLKNTQIQSAVMPQQKSDISATVMDHHQHEEEKKVTTEIKASEDHPNKHEVQVEDLSDSKPFQQPTHHVPNMHGDHKPNILDDHLSAHDFTTSTTTVPSILRHRPLPVAELFARAHGN